MLSYYTIDSSRLPSECDHHQRRGIEEKLLPKAFGSCLMYQGSIVSMPQRTHDDELRLDTLNPYKPEPSKIIANHLEKEIRTSHKRTNSNSVLDFMTEDYHKCSYPKAKQLKATPREIPLMHFVPYSMPEEDSSIQKLHASKKDFEDITEDTADDTSQSSDCASVATIQSFLFESAWNGATDVTEQIKFVSQTSSSMKQTDYFFEDFIHGFDVEPNSSSNCPHFQTGLSERHQKEDKPERPTNFLLRLINSVLEQPDGVTLSFAGESHHKNVDEKLNHLFSREVESNRIDKLVSPLDETHGLFQRGSGNTPSDLHDADASTCHGINCNNEEEVFDSDLDSVSRRVHSIANNLDEAMKKSNQSMSLLQEWDKKNGLPKSHSQTMVNSSRSREQLMTGMVLQKWNGRPLLSLPGAKVKIVRKAFRGIPVADSSI